MRQSKLVCSMLMFLAAILVCHGAHAHNLWLNPEDHYPEEGDSVDIRIGWGHAYPESRMDEEVDKDTVEEIYALDPDGQKVELERVSPSKYKLQTEKPGAYRVRARVEPGMFTTTPEGREWGSKKEVEEPLECTAFQIMAKTVLVAGGKDRSLQEAAGQPLEIIPLEDPSELEKGDKLPIRVLFDSEPASGIELGAKYAGYEGEAAGHDSERSLPAEARTDEQGEAFLQMKERGHWKILLDHHTPYPDREVCDERMYNAAFTLHIK